MAHAKQTLQHCWVGRVSFRFLFFFSRLGDAVPLGRRELLVNPHPILTGMFFHRLVSLLLQLAVVRLKKTNKNEKQKRKTNKNVKNKKTAASFGQLLLAVVGWKLPVYFFCIYSGE